MTEDKLDYDIKCVFDDDEVCWRQKKQSRLKGLDETKQLLFCIGCKLYDINGAVSDLLEWSFRRDGH